MSNVSWIVGGLAKKGDKFLLSKKKCKNFKAYIFGKNRNHFVKELKNKMKIKDFKNLNEVIKKIILDLRKEKNKAHHTILFSPASASFDEFNNFEERGKKFNSLVKKFKLIKMINAR